MSKRSMAHDYEEHLFLLKDIKNVSSYKLVLNVKLKVLYVKNM